MDVIAYDCNACGACCAYAPDWPALETEQDLGETGPPAEWRGDGAVRWAKDRCAALQGTLGVCTSCRIYDHRPRACRDCTPGSPSCLLARRFQGLTVPLEPSPLEEVLAPSGRRPRLR